MKKRIMYKLFGGLALTLLSISCVAQTNPGLPATPGSSRPPDSFAYSSALDTVRQAGFYRITLTPDLVAKCREDLADLRIADKGGKFVSYVLRSDLPVFTSENFTSFPILSNEKLRDSSTQVVIANGASGPVSTLLLIIKNSSVLRTAVLSGSDDRRQWFVIREHIVLEEAGSDTADHYVQAISFPPSTYRFFKLILDDKGLLPVNILKAGVTTRHSVDGKYLGVPFPALMQKDSSNKHSYITLQYRDHYRIDRLELILKGPAFFKRRAVVYDAGASEWRQLAQTELTAGNSVFPEIGVKTNRLVVDIANEDDKPLTVQAVRTAGLDQYLLAYLQPGEGYHLLAGNPLIAAPEYDLKYFADSLGKDPHELASGPLQPVLQGVIPAPLKPDHSGFWLWVVLGAVLILLALLSFNMAKAIAKKKA